MSTLLFVIAQSQPQQSMLGMFLPLVLIIVVFYFFMIRPQMKRQKRRKNFVMPFNVEIKW